MYLAGLIFFHWKQSEIYDFGVAPCKNRLSLKKIYGKSFHQVKLQVEDICTSIQPVLGYHLTGALTMT
jgi:hypothetical protein